MPSPITGARAKHSPAWVDVLRGTVDVTKRDVALDVPDLVGRLEAAAQKLVAAQGQADEYLAKVSEVIAATHRTFSEGMGETLGRANSSFHQALTNATSQLSTAFSELEEMLADLSDRPRH